jgi:transcription initiation factor IIE alpha subunit
MKLDENKTTTGRRHPATSIEAACRAVSNTGGARRRVLEALADHDLTDEELQDRLRMGANTQRPRRVELVRLGLITASDQRRPTMTGCWSTVWTITTAGHIALAAVDR